MSINRVVLSGNLTRDCELRTTQGGTSIASFGMAVNDRRKNPQTGEWEDTPSFVDLCIFGNRATALAGYLVKGTKVAVEGKLRYSSWEKDGFKHSKLEVVVDEIEFLSARQQGQQQAHAYQQPPQQYAAPTAQMPQAPAYQAQQTFYPNQAPLGQHAAPQQPQEYGLASDDIPF